MTEQRNWGWLRDGLPLGADSHEFGHFGMTYAFIGRPHKGPSGCAVVAPGGALSTKSLCREFARQRAGLRALEAIARHQRFTQSNIIRVSNLRGRTFSLSD